MTGRSFIDTNIPVYALDFDEREAAKHQIAVSLMRSQADRLVVSTQVLQEYYNVLTRKFNKPLTPGQALTAVRDLARLPVVLTDSGLVLAAAETSQTAQISIWDALIVEAAHTAGCERVLTEDLNDGQLIRGVRVENPFRDLSQSGRR